MMQQIYEAQELQKKRKNQKELSMELPLISPVRHLIEDTIEEEQKDGSILDEINIIKQP